MIWMPSGPGSTFRPGPRAPVVGSRMMGTAAAASRACSAWTSRTWIQVITECPEGPGRVPRDLQQSWAGNDGGRVTCLGRVVRRDPDRREPGTGQGGGTGRLVGERLVRHAHGARR